MVSGYRSLRTRSVDHPTPILSRSSILFNTEAHYCKEQYYLTVIFYNL